MNNVQLLLIIFALVIVEMLTVLVFLPLLKKKGMALKQYLDTANNTVVKVDQVFDTIKPFLPNTPAVGIVDKALEYAKLGVDKAEQLYHIGLIDAEQRKTEAKKFILDALALAKIEDTPELDKVIDGAIEASVLALGHKESVQPIQPTAEQK